MDAALSIVARHWRRAGLLAATAAGAVLAVAAARAVLAARRGPPTARPASRGTDADSAGPAAAYHARIGHISARLSAAIQLRTISWDPPDALDSAAAATAAAAPPRCGCHAAEGAAAGAPVPSSARDETRAALLQFHALLREYYPRLHAAAELKVINDLSLVFVLRGRDAALPATAIYAHMDVVPAPDADLWASPPFAGAIVDGHVVGRGAMYVDRAGGRAPVNVAVHRVQSVAAPHAPPTGAPRPCSDDKQAVIASCEAVEALLARGWAPRRTLALVFGHDEEIGGFDGAQHAYAWLAEAVRPATRRATAPLALLLDEGLFVLSGAVPGLPPALRTALICTEEKGFVTVRLGVTGVTGGHASAPPAVTAAGVLARAVARLEAAPFPARFGASAAVAAMFRALLPDLDFAHRLIFANAGWLTRPLVSALMAAAPTSAALVRTTTAATVVRVGTKSNTLSPDGYALVNHRIMPGESVAGVLARDARVIGDARVTLSAIDPVEPSPISDASGPAFRVVADAVEAACAGAIAVPALMAGATDSRWAWGVAAQILRHSPTELRVQDVRMFHGRDERISLPNLARTCAFYELVVTGADAATLDGDGNGGD